MIGLQTTSTYENDKGKVDWTSELARAYATDRDEFMKKMIAYESFPKAILGLLEWKIPIEIVYDTLTEYSLHPSLSEKFKSLKELKHFENIRSHVIRIHGYGLGEWGGQEIIDTIGELIYGQEIYDDQIKNGLKKTKELIAAKAGTEVIDTLNKIEVQD